MLNLHLLFSSETRALSRSHVSKQTLVQDLPGCPFYIQVSQGTLIVVTRITAHEFVVSCTAHVNNNNNTIIVINSFCPIPQQVAPTSPRLSCRVSYTLILILRISYPLTRPNLGRSQPSQHQLGGMACPPQFLL